MISVLHRTIATILTLSATAAVACACGGSRAASDAGARGAASAATGSTGSIGSDSPALPGSKVSAATLAVGEAVNLRRSDVPGMMQILPQGEAVGSHARKVCGIAASLTEELGGFHSPEFIRGGGKRAEAVRSAVRLAPSPAVAAHHAARNASPAFRACYERFLRKQSRRSPAGPYVISVSALPSPLPGVSGSFAYRVMKRASHPAADRIPIYVDFFGFTAGRVEVALTGLRVSQPFPAATERRLLSLLLSRAKANEP
jgi:hypothetical protein